MKVAARRPKIKVSADGSGIVSQGGALLLTQAMRALPSKIAVRAMFIGAAGVSARRQHRSGTGTRVMAFAGVHSRLLGRWVSVR